MQNKVLRSFVAGVIIGLVIGWFTNTPPDQTRVAKELAGQLQEAFGIVYADQASRRCEEMGVVKQDHDYYLCNVLKHETFDGDYTMAGATILVYSFDERGDAEAFLSHRKQTPKSDSHLSWGDWLNRDGILSGNKKFLYTAELGEPIFAYARH